VSVNERRGETVRFIQQGAGPSQPQHRGDLIKPPAQSVGIGGLPAAVVRVDVGPSIQKHLDSDASAASRRDV